MKEIGQLMEWRTPKVVISAAIRALWLSWWPVCARITLYVAAALVVFTLVVKRVAPDLENALPRIVVVILGMVLCLWAFPLMTWLLCVWRQPYRLTAEGIVGAGPQGTVIKWAWLKAYGLATYGHVPGYTSLVLYTEGRTCTTLILPADERAQRIVAHVAERLPAIEDSPEVAAAHAKPLVEPSGRVQLAMAVTAVIIGVASGFLTLLLSGEARQLVFLIPFVIGGGTVVAAAVYGKGLFSSTHAPVWFWAFGFNCLTGFVFAATAMFLLMRSIPTGGS